MKKGLVLFFTVSGIFLLVSLSIHAFAQGTSPSNPNASAISLQSGFKIEPYVNNLSVPTTAIFDGQDLLIAESGWKDTAKPRVVRIKPNGAQQVVVSDGLLSPVTGLLLVNGRLYISHRTKISYVANDKLVDIVTDLPSNGDHQNNKIVLGPDGRIYVGQGTTTNSGVVGLDNYVFGWLPDNPQIHDIPCQDIILTGQNFQTKSPLKNPAGQVTTGAYLPYGTPSTPGEVIKGNAKCSGAILSFKPDGSDLKVVAWGMRNPFGVQFDSNGQLWSTFHGADVRGSRNIYNDPDYLVKVQAGAWYGWPDYFDSGKPASAMKEATKEQPQFLLKEHPQITEPYLTFQPHSAANGLAFSPGGTFGYSQQAFVAFYGTFGPATAGLNELPAGFKVVRVDLTTKKVTDFAVNKLPGPAYINRQGGFNRPSDVIFGPDQSMYVIDWGASTIGPDGLKYVPQTGVIWRIYSSQQKALRQNGPVLVSQDGAVIPASKQKVDVKNVPELYQEFASDGIFIGCVIIIIILLMIFIKRSLSRKHTSVS